jgi:glycosyltransferase involved in cell wall biosynthesis
MTRKPNIIILSDSPHLSTGFATVAKNIASRLKEEWDISFYAIGYAGDYTPLQQEYKLYTTGDGLYGGDRAAELIKILKPDCVFIINDPWVAGRYTVKIRAKNADIPIIVYTPVDAHNLNAEYVQLLNLATHVIAYTQFGIDRLQESGLDIPTSIIPHGVDSSVFYSTDKNEARNEFGFPQDRFVVLNINANNPRKNLDFFFFIFSEWVKTYKHDDALVYYHGQLKGQALNVEQYCEYLGIDDRLMISDPRLNGIFGFPVDAMRTVYNCADVFMTTCCNEGWGLTTHEAMACGIPTIAPDHAAVAEWAKGGFYKVAVDHRYPKSTYDGLNTVHYLPQYEASLQSLEDMYQRRDLRKMYSSAGYKVATQNKYNWENIVSEFNSVFKIYLGKVINNGESNIPC